MDDLPDGWTEKDVIEWWGERAGILEYDGHHSMRHAELLAAREVKRRFGGVPDEITQRLFG